MPSSRTSRGASDAPVAAVTASAYAVPTSSPESDGTLAWTSTTLVVADVEAAGVHGTGYAYAAAGAVSVIARTLTPVVSGVSAFDTPAAAVAMQQAVRNIGRQGVAASAIAAVDAALWDLKGRLLGQPVITLLGAARPSVPVYGSGGFTSYDDETLCRQLEEWVHGGIARVKMKVGRERTRDAARVQAARAAIGADAALYVDANGAWTPTEALAMAKAFADSGVSWFEEPVSSDDLEGMRRVRDRAPAGMAIAAGEYGYDLPYFRRMLSAGAVDILQADATRCAGLTGFLAAGAVADAFAVPLSAHTAPSLHVSPCCALPRVRDIEYFHDHVRIEQMLFDGAPRPSNGCLAPDTTRPGLGLDLKRPDADRYQVA